MPHRKGGCNERNRKTENHKEGGCAEAFIEICPTKAKKRGGNRNHCSNLPHESEHLERIKRLLFFWRLCREYCCHHELDAGDRGERRMPGRLRTLFKRASSRSRIAVASANASLSVRFSCMSFSAASFARSTASSSASSSALSAERTSTRTPLASISMSPRDTANKRSPPLSRAIKLPGSTVETKGMCLGSTVISPSPVSTVTLSTSPS